MVQSGWFLNKSYHKHSHAAMIRAWSSVLVAPHYPEARLEYEVAHLWQSRSTCSSLCSNGVDPSVLGVFITTTTPLPGIPYNAIASTYHISLLNEWQDSACKISKRIFSTSPILFSTCPMLDRLGRQSCLYACQVLSRICRVEDGPIASLSHVSSGSG